MALFCFACRSHLRSAPVPPFVMLHLMLVLSPWFSGPALCGSSLLLSLPAPSCSWCALAVQNTSSSPAWGFVLLPSPRTSFLPGLQVFIPISSLGEAALGWLLSDTYLSRRGWSCSSSLCSFSYAEGSQLSTQGLQKGCSYSLSPQCSTASCGSPQCQVEWFTSWLLGAYSRQAGVCGSSEKQGWEGAGKDQDHPPT